jgi:hypothetical protein
LKDQRFLGLVSLIVVAMGLLACEATNIVAFLNQPTETPTRTPRPTFTPRPSETSTPEDTPTPETTDTPEASPTSTKRAVIVRSPTPKPTTPPQPTTPQFAWHQDPNVGSQGRCDAGPSVFEVKGRVISGGNYLGGIHVVVLDRDGKVVAQTDSIYPIQMNLEEHVSCFEVRNRFNYQLDVTAARNNGPLTLRLTKSAGDLTPISTDIKFDVDASGGRWYYNFVQ